MRAIGERAAPALILTAEVFDDAQWPSGSAFGTLMWKEKRLEKPSIRHAGISGRRPRSPPKAQRSSKNVSARPNDDALWRDRQAASPEIRVLRKAGREFFFLKNAQPSGVRKI